MLCAEDLGGSCGFLGGRSAQGWRVECSSGGGWACLLFVIVQLSTERKRSRLVAAEARCGSMPSCRLRQEEVAKVMAMQRI